MLRHLVRIVRWLVLAFVAAVVLLGLALAYDSVRPPISTLMLGRMATGQAIDRVWVPLAEVSSNLSAAVIMSEDGQFCSHDGVDWDALHAVMSNPDGPSRGASTLTMQVAKNLFLWPGRSYIRKGLEIPLALVLDAVWSKKRILEAYFNIAEWGDGLYGAQAAANRYFRKPAARLTTREAALLATSLPNPALRNPQKPTRLQRTLTGTVLARMADADQWTACLR